MRVSQSLLSLPTHQSSPIATSTMLQTSPSHLSVSTTDKGFFVPPLDVERFDGSFKHFCLVKRLVLDPDLLRIGGRDVSLHSLHEEVMENRGYDIREVRD